MKDDDEDNDNGDGEDGEDDYEDEDLEDQLVLLHDLRTCHHSMTHSCSFLKQSSEGSHDTELLQLNNVASSGLTTYNFETVLLLW